jgi:hypothetical protein
VEPAGDVAQFMAELDHPLKDGVEMLRSAILGADPGITEHVKWKAPSFRYAGVDRVTFHLRRADASSWSSTGGCRCGPTRPRLRSTTRPG